MKVTRKGERVRFGRKAESDEEGEYCMDLTAESHSHQILAALQYRLLISDSFH
jgi:hypothetical protein